MILTESLKQYVLTMVENEKISLEFIVELAIKNGDLNILKEIFSHNHEYVEYGILTKAAAGGYTNLLSYILDNLKYDNEEKNKAFLKACLHHQLKSINILLNAGAT